MTNETVYYYEPTDEIFIVDTKTRHMWFLLGTKRYKRHRYCQFHEMFAWSVLWANSIKLGDL